MLLKSAYNDGRVRQEAVIPRLSQQAERSCSEAQMDFCVTIRPEVMRPKSVTCCHAADNGVYQCPAFDGEIPRFSPFQRLQAEIEAIGIHLHWLFVLTIDKCAITVKRGQFRGQR